MWYWLTATTSPVKPFRGSGHGSGRSSGISRLMATSAPVRTHRSSHLSVTRCSGGTFLRGRGGVKRVREGSFSKGGVTPDDTEWLPVHARHDGTRRRARRPGGYSTSHESGAQVHRTTRKELAQQRWHRGHGVGLSCPDNAFDRHDTCQVGMAQSYPGIHPVSVTLLRMHAIALAHSLELVPSRPAGEPVHGGLRQAVGAHGVAAGGVAQRAAGGGGHDHAAAVPALAPTL